MDNLSCAFPFFRFAYLIGYTVIVTTVLQITVENGLAGTLPMEMRELIALRSLWMYGNDLSGEIPTTLMESVFLEQVRLENNQLVGLALPWQYSSRAYSQLRDYRVAGNALHGSLADVDWERAPHLQTLDLSWNFLTGHLSYNSFWELPELQSVSLSGNLFSGSLPDSLGTSVEIVNLDHNQLWGLLPASLAATRSLIVLNLRANDFHGSVPSSWFSALDDLGTHSSRWHCPRHANKWNLLTNLVLFCLFVSITTEVLDVSENENLTGGLEVFCVAPRATQIILASCQTILCSCCECV